MDESFQDMPFPIAGIDLLHGFDQQRPLTTPKGINVRAFEPKSQRGRGGSRQGISKYIATPVAGAGKIQCLATVVNTDALALSGAFNADDPSFPTYPLVPIGGLFGPAFPFGLTPLTLPTIGGGPTSDWVLDPSSPGAGNAFDGSGGNGGRNPAPARRIRNGGQGRQPGRFTRSSGTKIALVQKFFNNPQTNITYPKNVTAGNLLLVTLAGGGSSSTTTFAPTDSLGNTWTQIQGFVRVTSGVVLASAVNSMWYTFANANGQCIVTFNQANYPSPGGVATCLLEYSNVAALLTSNSNAVTQGNTTASTGSVAVTTATNLVVASFLSDAIDNNYSITSGFTYESLNNQVPCGPAWLANIYDSINLAQASYNPTITEPDGSHFGSGYMAIAAVFSGK